MQNAKLNSQLLVMQKIVLKRVYEEAAPMTDTVYW